MGKSVKITKFKSANSRFRDEKFLLSLALLFVCVFAFANCKSEPAKSNIETPTREVTDDLNRKVSIPVKIERAISLAPNLTENIFAVGAGDRLVGVTTYCNFPAEAQKIQKIGDTLNPNMETIVALRPNVVFVSTASQIEAFTKTLADQNIAVYVTNPKDLDGVYKSIFELGDIFGHNDRAAEIFDEMKRRVADVEARTANAKDVRIFVQIDRNSLYTIGKDSFITDLIYRAGGASVTADLPTGYPKISKETALALQPEAIILSDSPDNLQPNEVFKDSPAVKNNRVFKIDADLLSRPSPRIVDALEQIARFLHPENFQ